MVTQLWKSVIAKYCDLSVSRRSVIDLPATEKSQYFTQPRPILILLNNFVNLTPAKILFYMV